MLINEATRKFIAEHAQGDVRKLALQGAKDAAVDLPMALQQIAGRQTARKKLPSWAVIEDMVYPPHLNMEQCSSEQTAKYKAGIVGEGECLIDLTGGFGVDFYWMSQGFKKRVYVEQDRELCAISSGNFRSLGLDATVVCGTAADYLSTFDDVADVIFLDPARRNEHGGRTYGIEDCTPNVQELLPLLLKKARSIVVKLSPMLDWRKAVEDLEYVSEVHIVSVNNECKELLLVLGQRTTDTLRILCVNDEHIFCWFPQQKPSAPNEESILVQDVQYLYEPNASIMKAGCFMALQEQYAVQQISANSHLFVSAVEIGDFPGRKFQILAISSMNKQELKETMKGIGKANVAVRNFPLSADELRKKLKIKDGGDVYLFATTLSDGQHRLFICRKIG